MKRIEILQYNPGLLATFQNPTDEEIAKAFEVIYNFTLMQVNDRRQALSRIVCESDPDLLKRILTHNPRFIKHIPADKQTLELCELATNAEPGLIRYCEYQTLEMAKRLLNFTFDHTYIFQYVKCLDEDLCLRALAEDGRALQYVPESLQSLPMVKLAIDDWAKSIRWARLPQDQLETAQIYALSKNIQVFEVLEPASSAVTDYYIRLCKENLYFPDSEGYNEIFSQEELYQMLSKTSLRRSTHKIFNLLNCAYQRKVLDSDIAKRLNLSKITLAFDLDRETLLRFIANGTEYDLSTLSEEELLLCIKLNDAFLDRLRALRLSDDFYLRASRFKPNALRYLNSFKEEYLTRLI